MPERTCAICRKKNEKKLLFRFSTVNDKYVYDRNQTVQSRGFYLCRDEKCLERLTKHKKIKIEAEEFLKVLNDIKKQKFDILNVLKSMAASGNLIYGIDENKEGVRRGKVKLLVIPEDIKENYIQDFQILSRKYNVKIVMIKEKKEFLRIFGRDLNIVGLISKKVVEGITKKMEVTNENKNT